jgi:glutamine amidotransferase
MICIIDYKIGNILSVKNALLKARLNCIVSNSHFEIKKAEALILPGVGSFQKGMKNLKDLNLIEILNEEVLE